MNSDLLTHNCGTTTSQNMSPFTTTDEQSKPDESNPKVLPQSSQNNTTTAAEKTKKKAKKTKKQTASNNNPSTEVEDETEIEDPNCPVCREEVIVGQPGIRCDTCKTWFHKSCLHMTQENYEELVAEGASIQWHCMRCLSIKANKIKWGEIEGEEQIRLRITQTYDEIISWHKNIFKLPRGKAGTDFIKELTKLIKMFVDDTKWSRIALALVHIFIPLVMQKPSSKSKAKDNAKYLENRLKLWTEGKINSLLAEGREIQKRLTAALKKKQESKEKAFCRLMLVGKVGPAMKFINNEDAIIGVHPLNDEIKKLLEEKHPKGRDVDEGILLPHTTPDPLPVIYEEIDAEKVFKAAQKPQGSGGPSLMDGDGWKHILCSKSYGNASTNLCQAIAELAKKLCREEIHPDSLHEYVACRLIPLNKGDDKWGKPGVRPIGIGEILRRIVGKVVVDNLRDDIIKAAGPLQTCAGLKAGIDASIHSMRNIFQDDSTEAILLVDAENAFNNLNRQAALHNIRELCPSFYRYLANTYQLPARMIVNDQHGNNENILSDEGSTQGDVTAMGMYAIGTKPLVDTLGEAVDPKACKQVWYADDSGSAGKIVEMKKWWDVLNREGPKYGYFPKPSKTILIVKDLSMLAHANEVFGGTGITIDTEGERHLGAVIGNDDFKHKYVTNKIEKWVEDVKQLAQIANDEPQLAYAAFTKALSYRWSFVQRTINNISHLFQPLEDIIGEVFIPAIVGRKVSDVERRILALPVRMGGLGIQNPVETADIEFQTSVETTENLTSIIYYQEKTFENLDNDKVKETIEKAKAEKVKRFTTELQNLKSMVDDDLQRCLELANEKGSGSWLNALPMQAFGYVLNKQEFRDSLCLRYGWKIPNTPQYCSCGEKNSVNHALTCMVGGYVCMRHNRIRDMEASILKDVCKDVRIEPELLPIGDIPVNCTNKSDKARLDFSAVGVWSPMERTFGDVRVTHPNCDTYRDKTVSKIYEIHEKEKKRSYNQRIVQVEKATFTPLIFTTSGGMAPECTRYHKKIAQLIAKKTKEEYSKVMNHLRTRIRFTLLKSTLLAVRGQRGKLSKHSDNITELSFNTMPEMSSFEV